MAEKRNGDAHKKAAGTIGKIVVIVLAVLALLFPVNIVGYEIVFDRISKEAVYGFDETLLPADLTLKTGTFLTDRADALPTYRFSGPGDTSNGLVVLSMGLDSRVDDYLPMIERLVRLGFSVVTYDYFTDGRQFRGLPEAVADLRCLIAQLGADGSLDDQPLYLLGHSLGAYASGAVMAYTDAPDAVILISPFNKSSDMLRSKAKQYIGFLAEFFTPYVSLYESLKFGNYSSASVAEGLRDVYVPVSFVYGEDDTLIPKDAGLTYFKETFGGRSRYSFLLLEDTAHFPESLDSWFDELFEMPADAA